MSRRRTDWKLCQVLRLACSCSAFFRCISSFQTTPQITAWKTGSLRNNRLCNACASSFDTPLPNKTETGGAHQQTYQALEAAANNDCCLLSCANEGPGSIRSDRYLR